jgi:pimeloyl-ACP methyl ester carboxylesterase
MSKIEFMIDFKNKVYTGSQDRKSLYDCRIPENAEGVIIFIHGYKGYKDWGAWNLFEKHFIQAGFGFVKFNMSHNGGTIDDPIDFPDLEAFGENRYTYELKDLDIIITEVKRLLDQELKINLPIYLVGHSRGGGVAVLKASRDERIQKVISLAGICTIAERFPTGVELDDWRREGVRYVLNGRTNQQMPHYFSFYEDYINHQEQLDIEFAATNLNIPFIQIHGDMDISVSISEGLNLANWTGTEVSVIKDADHTFGTKQPWENNQLPNEMKEVISACIEFLNKQPS